jgi:Na+/H+ antiporter NhaD/arsenite permease-like protein
VIIGDAARLTFIDYFLWMFFPTLVGTLVTLCVLELLFIRAPFLDRSAAMQRTFEPISADQMEQLLYGQEPMPAGSPLRAEAVVLDAGAKAAAGDGDGDREGTATTATAEVRQQSQAESSPPTGAPDSSSPQLTNKISMVGSDAVELMLGDAASSSAKKPQDESAESRGAGVPVVSKRKDGSSMRSWRTMMVKLSILAVCLVLLTISSFIHLEMWYISVVGWLIVLCYDMFLVRSERGSLRSFLWMATKRMPWEVAFYVTFMFSMVAVLTAVGFTGRFAGWMLDAAGPSGFTASLSFGYISALLANVLCDLPATAFWSDMIRLLCDSLSPAQYRTVVLSLLLGNTYGCYMTTVGALAGLMWLNILRTAPGHDRVVLPRALELSKFGIPTACVVLLFTTTVVSLEVLVMYGPG